MVPKVTVLLVLSLVLLLADAVLAESQPTPQEWKEIEADLAKTKREQPNEYRRLVALAQMALGLFGFGIGPFDGNVEANLHDALRKYRRVRNLPETGDLDAKTLSSLMRDFESWNKKLIANVYLPGLHVFVVLWDRGYVSAKGTWVIVGEKSGLPLQTTEINCHKDLGLCFESTAILNVENSFLSVSPNHYKIERWDRHEILTKPDNSAQCVRYTMRIGRLKKSATGLRLRTNDKRECKDFSPELHLKLVDGLEVMKQVRTEYGEKLKGVMQAPAWINGP
jgi:hypothetical protein